MSGSTEETGTTNFNVDLTGKVALVTGGSRGMGKCMSEAFAACGANVVVASRKVEPCEALAEELNTRFGTRNLGVGAHVGNWDECDALIKTVLDTYGRIDILVNNAGMSPLYDKLSDVTEALYDKVHQVNARGPFRLTTLAGEHMAENDGGSIINVSSVAAVNPAPHELPYAVAKAGLNAMTLSFAQAFGPKVRVNCIMPGPWPRRSARRNSGCCALSGFRPRELHHRRYPQDRRRCGYASGLTNQLQEQGNGTGIFWSGRRGYGLVSYLASGQVSGITRLRHDSGRAPV